MTTIILHEDNEVLFTHDTTTGFMELTSKVIPGIRIIVLSDNGHGECQMEYFIPTPHPVWQNHQAFPTRREKDGKCFRDEDKSVVQYWIEGGCNSMPLAYSQYSAAWKRRLLDLVDVYFTHR